MMSVLSPTYKTRTSMFLLKLGDILVDHCQQWCIERRKEERMKDEHHVMEG